MKLIISLLMILLISWDTDAYTDIAILPYRVKNPSRYFKTSRGIEYSKLLSVAAIYKKNLEITSPRDIVIDLKNFGLSVDKLITGEDLKMLGKSRYLDYILLGSIAKIGKKIISESILYSVKGEKTVIKTRVKADNLYTLAEKEIKSAFIQYSYSKPELKSRLMDVAFIIDLSYHIKLDWEKVKQGILESSGNLIDSLGYNSRIYIFPFSDKYSYHENRYSDNSLVKIRKSLNRLKPFGGGTLENFNRTLAFTLKNIRWRDNSIKNIIIISNSKLPVKGHAERYGIIARKKGIKINPVSLGNLKNNDTEYIEMLARITGGRHRKVSYRQKVFNSQGKKIELYMENGRLFDSRSYFKSWREGILAYSMSNSRFGKPKNNLNEIFFDERKLKIKPYNMSDKYINISGEKLINRGKLESNARQIIGISAQMTEKKSDLIKPIGRVLLSDNRISFWSYIYNKSFFNFFNRRESKKFFFPLGINIMADRNEVYGLTFIPRTYRITGDYIPDFLKVKISDLIKRKRHHMRNGLYYPPLWFIKVKVDKLERFKRVLDIREQ